MLLALWSPKGGSGTSVVTAALALTASDREDIRLADLGGDQPTILGLPPADGSCSGPRGLGDNLTSWLAFGPSAPTEWLDDIELPVLRSLFLLPGGGSLDGVGPEAGAALGIALRDGPKTVLDAGTLTAPAAPAIIDVADLAVMVIRPCYLALRRAVGDARLARSCGALLDTVDEAADRRSAA